MFEIGAEVLTPADVVALARSRTPVRISPDATERARASYVHAHAVSAIRPVYGRSTGVGANRTIAIDDPDAAALRLLRSHATSAGERRAPERVRAMLAVRVAQLAAGGSGADPRLLDRLATLLTEGAVPPVRELGSIGTGDLCALAVTALALTGEIPLDPPLSERYEFAAGDALAFLSSNAATLADAALALVDLRRLALAALPVAAMSFVALQGNAEAFALAVDRVTPFPGANAVGRVLRALIDPTRAPARIQDPFALRTLPQVHGALLDALDRLDDVLRRLINAPSENPVLLPELGIAHHGGFHAAYLGQALDAVRLALAQAAELSLDRLTLLAEPAYTGRESFLGDGTPAASG
ncbi:MAG: aromatic amino acid lyase, partial [Actinobacteria bacterium]|nr:aromatic amino acid lyase [Actinomycetota bacterium]